jgi:hypothetical protein
MSSIARTVAVVCCAVAVSGCSYTYTSKPNVGRVTRIDDMILSVQDVRRIADADDLAPRGQVDTHKPPPADGNAPGPCRAVGHNENTFGSGWSEFRSAGYHGVTDDIEPLGNSMINGVTQAVARYPDSATAQAAFHQLESALQACVALHNTEYDFALNKADADTLRLTDHQWCHLYRLKAGVMISVGAVGLEAADQIASSVLQTITDRVT